MEKRRVLIGQVPLFIVSLILITLPPNSESIELDNSGRAIRNQLGTLYTLRSKLANSARTIGGGLSTPLPLTTVAQLPLTPLTPGKGSTGHAFHYYPSEVVNPNFPANFQNRMGRVSDSGSGGGRAKPKAIKWKKTKRMPTAPTKNENVVNSFNVHRPVVETAEIVLPEGNVTKTEVKNDSIGEKNGSVVVTVVRSGAPQSSPPTTPPPSTISQIQSIGQGINNALTTILTRKLMKMLDQDVPPGIFMPLKHLVATGNEMVDYWDKRATARGGESPGLVELLGYGLDQLKKLRDGHAIKPSDPVANLTSPSVALIEGIVTVKRLTNRVLGHDTSNEVVGRGHGHDSGYGHMSYGHYLDPYAILATLGFGVFLFNVIFHLLNNSGSSGRSLDVDDLDVPLALSDVIGDPFMEENFFGTPTIRNKRGLRYEEGGEEMFDAILDKLDGVFRTYSQISKTPKCARIHMCRLAIQDYEDEDKSVLSPLYMYGLEQLGQDQNPTQFLENIKSRLDNGENVDCGKLVEGCESKPRSGG